MFRRFGGVDVDERSWMLHQYQLVSKSFKKYGLLFENSTCGDLHLMQSLASVETDLVLSPLNEMEQLKQLLVYLLFEGEFMR